MTTGVPGRGDGGYADAPTAPTPLAWGAGGHTPTQPLPGVPHTPTSPGMPRPAPGAGGRYGGARHPGCPAGCAAS